MTELEELGEKILQEPHHEIYLNLIFKYTFLGGKLKTIHYSHNTSRLSFPQKLTSNFHSHFVLGMTGQGHGTERKEEGEGPGPGLDLGQGPGQGNVTIVGNESGRTDTKGTREDKRNICVARLTRKDYWR